jgi:hypothetical protein
MTLKLHDRTWLHCRQIDTRVLELSSASMPAERVERWPVRRASIATLDLQ